MGKVISIFLKAVALSIGAISMLIFALGFIVLLSTNAEPFSFDTFVALGMLGVGFLGFVISFAIIGERNSKEKI